MKLLHTLLLSLILSFPLIVQAQPLEGLIERLLPQYQQQFEFSIAHDANPAKDYFEISSKQGKIHIQANSPVSAAAGLNWYIKYVAHGSFSFCGDQLQLPQDLPAVEGVIRKETPLTCNFYMNYCTFSYTTAFWDWERWEREIDLMALNGITTPMAMVGVETVWRNTLRHFGYTDDEIKAFLCGPAYFAWLWMSNLEAHGGPLPDEWFDRQTALQQKIVNRMREWGMTPVFQGFYGMVPHSLQSKYPHATYSDQGEWAGFERPLVLLSTDSLFRQMAQVWYAQYEQLYGRTTCFAGDLFHEGGQTEGLDVARIAAGVQQSMLDYEPQARWFIQCWGGNPRNDLLAGLHPQHTVIVDLAAEFWSRWKERKGFGGFQWLWSHVTNYGGNVGLHGRLDAIAQGVWAGRTDAAASPSMLGTSSTPEGIEVNPVAFDLANEMRWHDAPIDVAQWVTDYAHRRYGTADTTIARAWQCFYHTAYGSYAMHRRPSESVFCAPPSLKGNQITASAWSQCRIFYDPARFAHGVALFLQPAQQLRHQATYRYDAVDMVRQYLSDQGRAAYYALVQAYEAHDLVAFKTQSKRFSTLLLDQDELLSTHPGFNVSTWLQQARAASSNEAVQDLYERNARQLIGTWTEEQSVLRDYAHREWGGMLRDYYYPRWQTYLAHLERQLQGVNEAEPNLYPAERQWVESHNRYKLSGADPVETALRLFAKYYTP